MILQRRLTRSSPPRASTSSALTPRKWRALPSDFPPWKTVYNYFQAWSADGTWQRLLDALRPRVRAKAGREPTPSACAIDSQSVKTAHGGQAVGTDGGKKVRGRKRHILVDTLGLLIAVVVTAANVDDARAAQQLFAQARGRDFPRLEVVYGDGKRFLVAGVWLNQEAVDAHLHAQGVADGARAEATRALVQRRVDEVNARLASYETIKKFAVIDRPLTVANGLLTPTLKVKRRKVYETFRGELEALYS